MKKIISLFMATIAACSAFAFVGCANRDEQLKMFIPGEYLDYELFDEFEKWYKDETGKKVEVVTPNTFDVVEEIITNVENKADYDLLLPSDYAVERLINRKLLKKVDKSVIDIEKDGLIKPQYLEIAKISDPALEYCVPYMYGTFGIMYDYSKTKRHIDSWSAIFTSEYKNKSANKDSLREAFSSAAIWANREELSQASNGFTEYGAEYKTKIQSIYNDRSDAALNKAKSALNECKSNIKDWGGESLKFDMAGGNTDIIASLMWSCDAGYVMNDYEDDDGRVHKGNRNIWYTVPKEGGNIYLDHFVISKYAKNVKAANYFLKFLCLKKSALANSAYAGAVSPVAEAYDELYEEYTSDEARAEETDTAWYDMYIEMLFPGEQTINRCGVMRDYQEANDSFNLAWANLRY